MRQISLWVGCAATLALLVGCPPPYPQCNSDEHCKSHNEVCVQGQCKECATNEHCPKNFVCQASKCVPKPECTSDAQCANGQKCLAGKCSDDPSAARKCARNDDCGQGEECREGTCQTRVAGDDCEFEPVRFGFNETGLSSDAQSRLGRLAECIRKGGGRITLEGHADERGTEEYNLQLSNRRAAAVKRYLTDLGVSGTKLETVGYGENRPAESGATEDAWAANRRVEFKR
jgi:peptidoglycan-associated lipoprotein